MDKDKILTMDEFREKYPQYATIISLGKNQLNANSEVKTEGKTIGMNPCNFPIDTTFTKFSSYNNGKSTYNPRSLVGRSIIMIEKGGYATLMQVNKAEKDDSHISISGPSRTMYFKPDTKEVFLGDQFNSIKVVPYKEMHNTAYLIDKPI